MKINAQEVLQTVEMSDIKILEDLNQFLSLTVDQAISVALSKSEHGNLDPAWYDMLLEKLGETERAAFTSALVDKEIVVTEEEPMVMNASQKTELEELKEYFIALVEEQGYVYEDDYHDIVYGNLDSRIAGELNLWFIGSGLPVRRNPPGKRVRNEETDYKKKVKEIAKNPDVRKLKDSQQKMKRMLSTNNRSINASTHLNKALDLLKEPNENEETEFLPPWKKKEAQVDDEDALYDRMVNWLEANVQAYLPRKSEYKKQWAGPGEDPKEDAMGDFITDAKEALGVTDDQISDLAIDILDKHWPREEEPDFDGYGNKQAQHEPNWETKQAKEYLLNDEGLYDAAIDLVQIIGNNYPDIADELEALVADADVMSPDDLANVDWNAIAASVFEWGEVTEGRSKGKKETQTDLNWETEEAEKWLLNDESLHSEAIRIAKGSDFVNDIATELEELFEVYDVMPGERQNIEWDVLAMSILDWSEVSAEACAEPGRKERSKGKGRGLGKGKGKGPLGVPIGEKQAQFRGRYNINFFEMGIPRGRVSQILSQMPMSGDYRITEDSILLDNADDVKNLKTYLMTAKKEAQQSDVPEQKFEIGDTVAVEGTSIDRGRVMFYGSYDDYLGDYRVKVRDEQGHSVYYNEKGLRLVKKGSKKRADLKLSPLDKQVILDFINQGPGNSKHFETDGVRLDGSWMGGRGLAHWEGDKLVLRDVGSKIGQTVHNFIRKNVPEEWVKGGSLKQAMPDSRKTNRMIRDVIEGWNDNELGEGLGTKEEVLDVLSNSMSEEAWGADVTEEFFYGERRFRELLEDKIIKNTLQKQAYKSGDPIQVGNEVNWLKHPEYKHSFIVTDIKEQSDGKLQYEIDVPPEIMDKTGGYFSPVLVPEDEIVVTGSPLTYDELNEVAGKITKQAQRKKNKQKWMREFDDLIQELNPEISKRQDYWDTAAYFYNQGFDPDKAVRTFVNVEKKGSKDKQAQDLQFGESDIEGLFSDFEPETVSKSRYITEGDLRQIGRFDELQKKQAKEGLTPEEEQELESLMKELTPMMPALAKFMRVSQRIDEEKRQLEDTIRSRQEQIPGWKKLLERVRKAFDFSELRDVWGELKELPAFASKTKQAQRLGIGDRVKVSEGSGLSSGIEGVIVPNNYVKTDGRGIPTNIPGHYAPVNWKKEVAIQLDDGSITTMFKNRLEKVGEIDSEAAAYEDIDLRGLFQSTKQAKKVKHMKLDNPEINALGWVAVNINPAITPIADSMNHMGVVEVPVDQISTLKRAIKKGLSQPRPRDAWGYFKKDMKSLLGKVERMSKEKERTFIANCVQAHMADGIFNLHMAESNEQKTAGLEPFEALDDNEGMLFPFEEPWHATFHMGKVKFPIDIIFLQEDDLLGLKVAKIVHNAQPGASERWSCQNTPVVIELKGGAAKVNKIKIGTVCQLEDNRFVK